MPASSGKWHLSAFPSELIGSILSFVDLWSVAILFCCGSKILNKNILSASGVRHIELPCRKYYTIHLPRVLDAMKGLKSVHLVSKESNSEFSPSSLEIMASLPLTLESLTLKGFSNVSSILMRPKSSLTGKKSTSKCCYPNLTSLVVFAYHKVSIDIHRDFHANLPPNLTKLQLPSVCHDTLDKLPIGLVTLKLSSVELDLLGSWIRRLPSLTKLKLSARRLRFDADGIKKLPNGLRWLSFGDSEHPLLIEEDDKRRDEDDDLNANAKFIFENLPKNLLHFEFRTRHEPKNVVRLNCWASLESMTLAFEGTTKLPPNLTSLSIASPPSDHILAAMKKFPVGLAKLIWDTWDPNPQELALLPKTLTMLTCTDLSASHLHLLPPSLTQLECYPDVNDAGKEGPLMQISGLKPFLEALPKVALERFNAINGWSWVRVKDLGKFVYKNWRSAPSNESDMVLDLHDQSDQILFSGVCGSGWTCLGHAIELDNPELADDILNFNPRLEYQLYNHSHFLLAVQLGSINMLQWFEKKRALSFYREYEQKHKNADGGLMMASKERHKTVENWLLTRGFSVNLTGKGYNLIDVAIRRDSSGALAWALSFKETLLAKLKKGETLSNTERKQLSRMRRSPNPHTLSLIHDARKCWNYLLEVRPLRKWPNRDARLLSPDVDLFAILAHLFILGVGQINLSLIEKMLLSHDEAIKEQTSQEEAEGSQTEASETKVGTKSKSKSVSKSSINSQSSSNTKPNGETSQTVSKSKTDSKPLRDVSRMSIGDCVVQAVLDSKPRSIWAVRGVLDAFHSLGVLHASHVSRTSGISLVTACAKVALRDADTYFERAGSFSDDSSPISDIDDDEDGSQSSYDSRDISDPSPDAHRSITKLFLWLHNHGADVWDIKGMGDHKNYSIADLAHESQCLLLEQVIDSGKFDREDEEIISSIPPRNDSTTSSYSKISES